jgi:bacteriocin-like protein
MSIENQNDRRELTENDLAAVTGGGYVQFAAGLGTRTDFRIAEKQLLESNFRGAIEVPPLRL